MALSDLFSRKPGRFVSERAFHESLAKQLKTTPLILAQLRKLDVPPTRELKLEYFFYTNTREKAASLATDLEALGYQVEHGASAADKNQYLVTGWTTAMLMNEEVVSSWTRKMWEAGYAKDCEFDGWGTSPKQ
jgi:regulator of RNase E activity RraB